MQKAWRLVSTSILAAAMASGQPSLSFSRSEVPGGGSQANTFAIADFNGDLKPDIAFASGSGTFVLLGRGDGKFETARPVNTGPPSFAILAADINGDGRTDLVMTNSINANSITVVLGRGDGTFAAPQQYPAGTTPMGIVAADVNGDGKLDLVVANIAGLVPSLAGKTVTVLLGKGDGTFGPPLPSPVLGERPVRLAAGDFNQDGKADVVVVNSSTPDVSLLISKGDGTFQTPRALSGPGSPLPLGIYSAVAVADFNLDGRADIAAQISTNAFSTVFVLLGNGDGSFQPTLQFPSDGVSFTVGDINGDGIPDLAAVSAFPYTAALVLLGRGDGSFQDEQAFDVGSVPTDLAIADFNGDGQMDLVVGRQVDSSLSIFLNTTPRPAISPNGVVNAASFLSGPLTVAPGEIVTIFGINLGPPQLVTARLKTPEFLDTDLAGTRVLFDGVAAPLVYVRADQVSAVVPYGVSGKNITRLQVAYGQTRSTPLTLRVVPSAPGIFTADASGSGSAAVFNQDGKLNSPDNAAEKSSIITFFATGEGQTNPRGVDGKLASIPLPQPVLPLVVGIANMGAEIRYDGAAPGLVAGLLQINAVIPPDAPSGQRIPLVIKVGDAFSQPGITIAIR